MIGDAYKGPALRALLDVAGLLWGAWLDSSKAVIAYTGILVPQESFEVDGDTVTNTLEIDGGAAPASAGDIAYFALMDDADDAQIVAYGPVTFAETPDEGEALAAAIGTIVLSWDEP